MCNRRQAREDASKLLIGWNIGTSVAIEPITERSKTKPKQTRSYFRNSIENHSYIYFIPNNKLVLR